jgi:hypothetical protein
MVADTTVVRRIGPSTPSYLRFFENRKQSAAGLSDAGHATVAYITIEPGFSGNHQPYDPFRYDMSIGRIRDSAIAWVMIMMALPVTATLLLPVLFPDDTCFDLWNEPDNAAVRSQAARGGFESAGITSDTFEGPGRVC